jgi:hypothetical protein
MTQDDLTEEKRGELNEYFGESVVPSAADDRDLYVSTTGTNSRSFESFEAYGEFVASVVDAVEYAYQSESNGHCFNVVDDGESRLDELEDELDMAYVADIEQQSDGYYTVIASDTNGFWQDRWDMERVRDDGFVVDSIRFTETTKQVTFMDTEADE